MPFVKAFEVNYNNQRQYVKTIKVYNSRGDQKLANQVIVDQGFVHQQYRTYDTSVLKYGNSILFYKRDEQTLQLCQYDLVTNQCGVLQGYEINEPVGQDVRYHVMFSTEFGENVKKAEKYRDVHHFLSMQFVACQSYRSNEVEFSNMPLVMWRMNAMKNSDMLRPHSGQHQVLAEPIQAVCHTKDPKSDKLIFLGIDPFSINEFKLDLHSSTYSAYTTFWGVNEIQNKQMEFLRDHRKSSQQKHESLSPFYLHQNAQFLIQNSKVTVTIEGQDKTYQQYFYRTNDN